MDFLLSEDEVASEMRRKFAFRIYPMVDVDGVSTTRAFCIPRAQPERGGFRSVVFFVHLSRFPLSSFSNSGITSFS